MQLGLTHDQLQFVKDWVKDPTIIAMLWWALRRGSTKGFLWLQEELLMNIKTYVGQKFTMHELAVAERFDAIESRMSVLETTSQISPSGQVRGNG